MNVFQSFNIAQSHFFRGDIFESSSRFSQRCVVMQFQEEGEIDVHSLVVMEVEHHDEENQNCNGKNREHDRQHDDIIVCEEYPDREKNIE